MMKGVVVILALLFGVASCHPLMKMVPLEKAPCSTTDCGSKIQDLVVKFDPDPPQTGKKLTITITGQIDEEITGGDVEVTAKWGIIPVLSSKYKVCDIVTGGCPFQGSFVGTAAEDITSSAPKATYSIAIKGTDQSGGQLLCIDAKCTFE